MDRPKPNDLRGAVRPCPFCKGRGRQFPAELDTNIWPDGIGCDPCNGTGDFDTMMLVRAYRLGMAHEHNRIISRINGGEPKGELTFETIRAAVVDDISRQRFEDALEVGA